MDLYLFNTDSSGNHFRVLKERSGYHINNLSAEYMKSTDESQVVEDTYNKFKSKSLVLLKDKIGQPTVNHKERTIEIQIPSLGSNYAPIRPYTESDDIQDYIQKSEIIDYDHKLIVDKCIELEKGTEDEISLIKKIYEFVRDDIHHSWDIGEQRVTCKASEVLEFGHGICCAKSHLLAAMLRFFGIPAGFCYQKLCSAKDTNKKFLHCLNAVYLKGSKKWIRLDARGNKPGLYAQFCIDKEKIARPVNKELGEEDNPIIFNEPNQTVVEILKKSNNMKELWMQWELGLRDLFSTTENQETAIRKRLF